MKVLMYVIGFLAVIQFLGCASKPKAVADDGRSAMAAASQVQSENLPATGSDSQKIAGLNSIHFDFDRAVIPTGENAGLIAQDAQWIKTHPGLKVQIEGHCDGRGSVEYNLALGERRARAVYNALLEDGVQKSRMSVISYGKERPLDNGDSDEAYAKNRRVNFVPLKEAAQNHLSQN